MNLRTLDPARANTKADDAWRACLVFLGGGVALILGLVLLTLAHVLQRRWRLRTSVPAIVFLTVGVLFLGVAQRMSDAVS